MNPLFYALLSILLVACSQFLFKKGVDAFKATPVKKQKKWKDWFLIFLKRDIFLGLFLNGVAAFFWLLALSDLDLSYIFPFLALNYIIIPIGAAFLFQEKLSRLRVIGIVVICFGVLLIAYS